MKYIYIVEEFDNDPSSYNTEVVYIASSFEKAKAYVNDYFSYMNYKKPEIKKMEGSYWVCKGAFYTNMGISRKLMDDEVWWRKEEKSDRLFAEHEDSFFINYEKEEG